MISLSSLARYIAHRLEYSASLSRKTYERGQITEQQLRNALWNNLFRGRLTYLLSIKGKEMAAAIGAQGGTLLVRKIPIPDSKSVSAGDVVVLKDPLSSDKHMVRKLAATEGYEMVSTNKNEEPFILEKNECWVLADNDEMKPKDAYDSRTFGPVAISNIVGRVLYCLRSAVDHGPVENSQFSMQNDHPVLEMELDIREMASHHKE